MISGASDNVQYFISFPWRCLRFVVISYIVSALDSYAVSLPVRSVRLFVHKLGGQPHDAALLLALVLEVHLERNLTSLLDDALLAGVGCDLALGGLVIEKLGFKG